MRGGIYKFDITFADGNEIHTKVEAKNRSEAKRVVVESDEFKRFSKSCLVVDMKVEREIHPKKPWNNHLEVTNVPNKAGWYMAIDLKHNIKLEFKKGKFEYRNAYPLRGDEFEQSDEAGISAVLEEIAEWLQEYFPWLVEDKPKQRLIPSVEKEGAREDRDGMPGPNGKVPCFFSLDQDVADFIKTQARERGMTQGDFIKWCIME
jgi:hypothetical protein